MEKRYLAIDIGINQGKAILGMMVDGRLTLEEIHRFENHPVALRDGSLCWDVDFIQENILIALKKAKEADKTPDYLGIDAWGSDYVLLDESDKPLGPCRYGLKEKDPAIDAVYDLIPFAELYEIDGLQFQPSTSLYQLMADVRAKRLAKAKTFLMLPDYLNFLLTGVKKQEYCNAASSGLLNASTRDWDEELFARLGYPKEIFLPLEEPGIVLGPLKKEVEEEIGYNLTVLLPATDANASMVLSLPLKKNEPYLACDQWPLIGEEEGRAHTNKKSRRLNYSNEGAPDRRFRYQKSVPGLTMIREVIHELGNRYTFFELLSLAQSANTSEVVDFDDIRFDSPESMIKAVEESVGRSLGPGELIDILLHSLAAHCASTLDELEALIGKSFECLHLIGSGAHNEYFVSLLSKAVNRPLFIEKELDASIGNLLMQMVASGEVSSIQEGRELIKTSFDIKPLKA